MQPRPNETPRRGENEPAVSVTLSALARESLARCDGDTVAAAEHVTEALGKDRSLWRAIAGEVVSSAAETAVQARHRSERASIVRGMQRAPADDPGAGRRRVEALASVQMRCSLDFPLKGGVKLRDATRDEVIDQAMLYEKSASDMGIKARWLYMVANRVPDGVSIGSVLSADIVESMYKDAANA